MYWFVNYRISWHIPWHHATLVYMNRHNGLLLYKFQGWWSRHFSIVSVSIVSRDTVLSTRSSRRVILPVPCAYPCRCLLNCIEQYCVQHTKSISKSRYEYTHCIINTQRAGAAGRQEVFAATASLVLRVWYYTRHHPWVLRVIRNTLVYFFIMAAIIMWVCAFSAYRYECVYGV